MASVLHELPQLQSWHALGLRIRCGLDPDEPRLIDHYLAEGRYLARFKGIPNRHIAQASFRLLLDTARDTVLPWHWRCLCLDQCWRPLRDLKTLASDRQWRACAYELASCVLQPSISLTELLQGHSDE